jgi:hypothetical protein
MLGCGGEGAEQTERVAQAEEIPVQNLISTGFLPVARVSYSPYGLLTLSIAKPFVAPLYLSSISIQEVSGSSILTGHITQGSSATSPGRVNLQVSQDVYDNLLALSTSAIAPPALTHFVQLTFDELSFVPTDITVM